MGCEASEATWCQVQQDEREGTYQARGKSKYFDDQETERTVRWLWGKRRNSEEDVEVFPLSDCPLLRC
jgi:outer membrane biogenesis lipoprotein LolB